MRESDGCDLRNFGMGPLIPVLVRNGGTVMEGHRRFLIDKAWREDKTIAPLGKLPAYLEFPSVVLMGRWRGSRAFAAGLHPTPGNDRQAAEGRAQGTAQLVLN